MSAPTPVRFATLLDGQQPYVKLVVEGAILLLFVTIDALARRGRAAAGRS